MSDDVNRCYAVSQSESTEGYAFTHILGENHFKGGRVLKNKSQKIIWKIASADI